jgi:hypothetical protein
MSESKTNCKKCGKEILVATASRTGEVCMPCRGKSPLAVLLSGAGIGLFVVTMTPMAAVAGIYRKFFGWSIHEWLVEQLPLEEVESMLGSTERALSGSWNKMKKKMIPGDELWRFRSPDKTWQKLSGREGICLKRRDKILDVITSMMN